MRLSETNPILRNLLSDIAAQPSWRGDAAKCMAWRDNLQWTTDQKALFVLLGLPEDMFVNLMAAAIDAVTGHEAKHRVDWMIQASAEEDEVMSEALNHELNDAMRLADANHACSEAYEAQACIGLGWVHVTRNYDPLSASKLLIEDVHRDEMFWDMRARSEDLRSDCRWIARRKFFDKDEAKIFLGPEHHELVDFTYSDYETIDIDESGQMVDWFNNASEYTSPIELIMDNQMTARKRVAIYEVYYKVFEKRDLMFLPNGMVLEFKKGNPMHLELLITGQAQLQTRIPVNIVRAAWFVGPQIIYDGPSNLPHNQFPYIPFFGPRQDSSNTPHGLLKRMMGPQEEYNRAVLEIQRILRSRRIEKDEDAVVGMSDAQVIFETNRMDGVINLKKNSKFQVIREWDKLNALEGICDRARSEINAASGIYQTFQGQAESDQSGVAVENLAELGEQTLGKVNANYQLGRKYVGELSLSYIIDDIGLQRRVVRIPQTVGQNKKEVILNDGMDNRVPMLRAQVALMDTSTSAGYRHHTHQRLDRIMDKIPDDYKTILLPFWLDSSEMPNKDQAIKLINKKLGFEEDEQRREEMEQAAAEEQQRLQELEFRKMLADVEETEASTKDKDASAKNKMAQASDNQASALKKRVETAKLLREFKMMGQAGSKTLPQGKTPDQRKELPPGASGVSTAA